MKTDLRTIAMAFSVFVILTVFFFDFFAYQSGSVPIPGGNNQNSQTGLFPSSTQYLNWTATYHATENSMGNWSTPGFFAGAGSVDLNFIRNAFAYPVAAVAYVFGFFTYVAVVVGWLGASVNFPFAHLPYPLNLLFDAMVIMMISLGIIFTVSILGSGFGRQ